MKNMPLQFANIVLSALLLAPAAQAVSVKADPLAERGCMPRVQVAEAQAVLKRFNLAVANARPNEIQTLGTALSWIEKLNDNRPLSRAVRAALYTYNFQTQIGNSRQDPNEAVINRNGPKNYGENVAQLAHELGHLIGNSNGAGLPSPDDNIYIDYINFVGARACMVSTYADDNSHEQFAEVFAAFVTRPELIKTNPSAACKKAYEFLSTKLFAPSSDALALRCMAHQAEIAKRANLPPSPASTAVAEFNAANAAASK